MFGGRGLDSIAFNRSPPAPLLECLERGGMNHIWFTYKISNEWGVVSEIQFSHVLVKYLEGGATHIRVQYKYLKYLGGCLNSIAFNRSIYACPPLWNRVSMHTKGVLK